MKKYLRILCIVTIVLGCLLFVSCDLSDKTNDCQNDTYYSSQINVIDTQNSGASDSSYYDSATTENPTDSSCGLTDASSGDATNDSQGGNGDGQEAIPLPIDGDSDYTIVFTDDPEICYLRFHDIRTYESRFVQEGSISFSSLEKLYDVLSNGKLEIYEKSIMSHWTSDENGIIICNFKNLYYPSGLPDCIELRNSVCMEIGGTYAFLIEPIKDNVLYSSMHIMESEMYKDSYDKAVKSLSQNYSNVQEKIIDGTTTVGRHYYRYDGRLMAVEYELNSQNKKICVIKKFFYEKTDISLYVQEDDVQYRVWLSCVNDIPDSELMKFSVSPYFSDNEDDTSNSGGSTAGDTTTPSDPPPREEITVRSVEELEKMKQMLDCKDEAEFSQYLQSIKCSGQIGRQKLGTFVSIVDKIPYIKIVDGEISWINYSKGISQDTGKETEVLYVATKKSDDEWCRIEYYLKIEEVSTLISEETSLLPTTIKSNDGRIEVFTENIKNETIISWLVTIDDMVARVVYKTKDPALVNVQEIYEDLTVSQILAK